MARFMKINLIKNKWHLCNTRKIDVERLKVMVLANTGDCIGSAHIQKNLIDCNNA